MASFKIAEIKTQDGEIYKDSFIKAWELLCQKFNNKSEILTSIKEMSLSKSTVMRGIEVMNKTLEDILKENINECRFLS